MWLWRLLQARRSPCHVRDALQTIASPAVLPCVHSIWGNISRSLLLFSLGFGHGKQARLQLRCSKVGVAPAAGTLPAPLPPPPAAGGLPARVAQAGAVGSVGLRVGPCGRVHAPGCTPRRGAARFTHPPAGTAQHPSHGMFSWSGSGFWSGVHFLVGTHLTHHHLGKDVARAP